MTSPSSGPNITESPAHVYSSETRSSSFAPTVQPVSQADLQRLESITAIQNIVMDLSTKVDGLTDLMIATAEHVLNIMAKPSSVEDTSPRTLHEHGRPEVRNGRDGYSLSATETRRGANSRSPTGERRTGGGMSSRERNMIDIRRPERAVRKPGASTSPPLNSEIRHLAQGGRGYNLYGKTYNTGGRSRSERKRRMIDEEDVEDDDTVVVAQENDDEEEDNDEENDEDEENKDEETEGRIEDTDYEREEDYLNEYEKNEEEKEHIAKYAEQTVETPNIASENEISTTVEAIVNPEISLRNTSIVKLASGEGMMITPENMPPAVMPILAANASWVAKFWALLDQPDVSGCVRLVEWCHDRTHFRLNTSIADYVGGGRMFRGNSVMCFYRQLNL